jgi:hypothetical protein
VPSTSMATPGGLCRLGLPLGSRTGPSRLPLSCLAHSRGGPSVRRRPAARRGGQASAAPAAPATSTLVGPASSPRAGRRQRREGPPRGRAFPPCRRRQWPPRRSVPGGARPRTGPPSRPRRRSSSPQSTSRVFSSLFCTRFKNLVILMVFVCTAGVLDNLAGAIGGGVVATGCAPDGSSSPVRSTTSSWTLSVQFQRMGSLPLSFLWAGDDDGDAVVGNRRCRH